MAIRGHLDRLKLFQVFRSLMQRRSTGVLTLQSGREVRRAEIINGYPVRTASNRRSEGLVHALIDEGLISSTEAAQVRALSRQNQVPVETLLTHHGLVAMRRLRSVQHEVARNILLAPFAWADGGYEFVEQVVRPDENAEGINLIDILVEGAARVVDEEVAQTFIRRFAGQYVAPTDLLRRHGGRFDTFFEPPNTRTMLEAPTRFDLIARTRGDRVLAAREVTCMVLSGLAQFQASSQVKAASIEMQVESLAQPSARSIRRVSAPANIAGRPSAPSRAPSRGAPAQSAPMRSAPPPPGSPLPPAPPRGRSAPPQRRSAPPRSAPPRSAPPQQRSAPPRSSGPPTGEPQHAVPLSSAPKPAAARSLPPQEAAAPSGKTPTRAIMQLIATAEEQGRVREGQTHYEILGLDETADTAAVRKSFRGLARDFHVDKFMRYALPEGALNAVQQQFIAVNRAHEVLANAAQRSEYDAELSLRAQGMISDTGAPDLEKVFAAEKLVKQGIALLKNGKAKHALDRFNEALATTPADPLGQAGQAYAELLVVQVTAPSTMVQARAIRTLEGVCADMEGRHEPFLYLGRAYRMVDDTAKAVAALTKALQIDPHCAEAASELRHLKRQPVKKSLFSRRKK